MDTEAIILNIILEQENNTKDPENITCVMPW